MHILRRIHFTEDSNKLEDRENAHFTEDSNKLEDRGVMIID